MKFRIFEDRNNLPKIEQKLLNEIEDDMGEPLSENHFWGYGYRIFNNRLSTLFLRGYPGNRRLSKLPDEICNATELESLSIAINKVKSIPKDIGSLKKLRQMFFGNNLITKIPQSLTQLHLVRTIELQNNRIEEFPENVGTLSSLLDLSLGNNLLNELPHDLGNLRNLVRLRIPYNNIQELPESTQQLRYLRAIRYGDNHVKEIPQWIGSLRFLEELSLHDNYIEELPESMTQLKHLRVLDLRNNSLEEIPIHILANLQSIENIYIRGNPLSDKFKTKFRAMSRLMPQYVRIDGWGIDDYFNKSDLYDR